MTSLNFFFTLFPYMVMFVGLSSAQQCYDNGNFTTNGTYANNRALLLKSLASNVTLNDNFYTTSIGLGNDTVYGHALCRTDASAEDCLQCVNNGIQDLLTNCPDQKEALSWGRGDLPPCTIHYANQPLSGKMELEPSSPGYLVQDLSSSINIDQFYQVWSSLMNRVGTKASEGSSKVKSATGEANFTSIQTIYVLMQCIPDMSSSNCSYCLQRAVDEYRIRFWGKAGGYTLKPSCWFRWDLYPFYELNLAPTPSLLPPPEPIPEDNKGIAPTTTVIIVVVPVVSFLAIAVFLYIFSKRRRSTPGVVEDDISAADSLQYDIGTIRVATNNFSDNNKLGEGGFGSVYKGRLPDGPTVAVKRWSRTSRQGEDEFKNEVVLVAMLQHRNLVRLLGFCLEDRERLLIYEFVPNLSLDHYIFDVNRGLLLDWNARLKIIGGIARGILYLHEDSRTRIIHRDLKASNILLDEQMNPKISDFGTARLFAMDQSQIATRRIVGTYGYMPPEYAIHGRFSIKSDVFSFGVLVLEIMSGQKVTRFSKGNVGENLVTYAWRVWNERIPLNLVDPILLTNNSRHEMLRCIHVALLCVQEDAAKRPTMASVVLMLSSHSVSLPLPSRPAFFVHSIIDRDPESSPNPEPIMESINEMSISYQGPR